MFIGHIALGLAGKRFAPKTSLAVSLMAVNFIDLLWPIFLLLGWETVRIAPEQTGFNRLDFISYPITHSLIGAVLWSVLFAGIYFARTRYRTGAIWLGLAVTSHWFLDAIVHSPDLPLIPGGKLHVGLGLWHSLAGTILLELLMFGAGVLIYIQMTRPRSPAGRVSFWSLIAFLLIMYFSSILGPPPPDERSLAWFALAAWLIPLWAIWIDFTRSPAPSAAAPLRKARRDAPSGDEPNKV